MCYERAYFERQRSIDFWQHVALRLESSCAQYLNAQSVITYIQQASMIRLKGIVSNCQTAIPIFPFGSSFHTRRLITNQR